LKRIIIVAVAKNFVIGRANGEMSWNIKEDFDHFKATTTGYPVLMGRKTYGFFKNPLPNREHIVITRDVNFDPKYPEVKVFHTLSEGFDYIASLKTEKMFIIGGGEIYKQVLEQGLVDEMIISWMNFGAVGEVCFTNFIRNEWMEISREKREQFNIVRYIRDE
jgi:dihydrofolate reductase